MRERSAAIERPDNVERNAAQIRDTDRRIPTGMRDRHSHAAQAIGSASMSSHCDGVLVAAGGLGAYNPWGLARKRGNSNDLDARPAAQRASHRMSRHLGQAPETPAPRVRPSRFGSNAGCTSDIGDTSRAARTAAAFRTKVERILRAR